jgi:hypothetical protein
MRGTKSFCICLGILLMVFSIIPAPFGLLVQTGLNKGIRAKLHQLLEDGSLTINVPQLAAKHGNEHGGYAAAEIPPDAEMATGNLLVLRAYHEVAGLVWAVTIGTFLMGLLWLIVGTQIPSKLPAQRAQLPNDSSGAPTGRPPIAQGASSG